jgi:trans-aconitate methyltransferase
MNEENNKIKEFFEKTPKEKFGGDYEIGRWFSSELDKSRYEMMKEAIKFHLKDIKYNKCFELGPGPGTWTKILFEHSPRSFYELVDISEEMHRQFRDKIGEFSNIDYQVVDFGDYNAKSKCDFFFSSRAIEYIDDKESTIRKINDILSVGGKGMIITKTPHYLKKKLLGQKTPWQHLNQIFPGEMQKILRRNNFVNIKLYPIVIYIPVLGRINVFNWIVWKLIYKTRLNFLTQFISEAYLVKFIKEK